MRFRGISSPFVALMCLCELCTPLFIRVMNGLFSKENVVPRRRGSDT